MRRPFARLLLLAAIPLLTSVAAHAGPRVTFGHYVLPTRHMENAVNIRSIRTRVSRPVVVLDGARFSTFTDDTRPYPMRFEIELSGSRAGARKRIARRLLQHALTDKDSWVQFAALPSVREESRTSRTLGEWMTELNPVNAFFGIFSPDVAGNLTDGKTTVTRVATVRPEHVLIGLDGRPGERLDHVVEDYLRARR